MRPKNLQKIRKAAAISTDILFQLYSNLAEGTTGAEINELAAELCRQKDVVSAFKGVPGSEGPFPGNLCLSVNDEVLHTVPKQSQVFKVGDLVSIDFGIICEGFYTDHCITVGIGQLSPEAAKLNQTTKLAVEAAVAKVGPGVHTGDLGHVLEATVGLAGLAVTHEYVGHGIGRELHMTPEVPAFGNPGTGDRLRIGQVICVEAQVFTGSADTKVADNGWDILSADGSLASMWEFMVEVTESGGKILTDTRDWPLVV